jgi:hypothetical protein
MRENSIPLTWENFLRVEFLGTPPELDGEVLAELTEAFDAAVLAEAGISDGIEEDE